MRSSIASVSTAIVAAAATPATVFAIMELSDQLQYFHGSDAKYALQAARTVWITAFAVAMLHALVLGLPAYFLLKRFYLIRWWVSLIAGFVIGFVPMAFLSWPYHPSNGLGDRGGNGGVSIDYIINGLPTVAGWLRYLSDACGSGFLGALCGFIAWLAWRGLSPKTTAHEPA